MKFIHCSDIHLDSKMESNLPRKLANQRRIELRDTFCRLVQYADENEVTAVIIAGDMFDERRCSITTLETVFDAIRNAPKVDFLYLQGNHGAADLIASVEVPDNFKQFGQSWTTFDYDNVSIHGTEITPQNFKTIYRDYVSKPNALNIVTLHGQISTQPKIDCVSLPHLKGKGIAYLALGHIHSYQCEALDHQGIWCYSGCLEGRGFDECGEKGFVEITVSGENSISERFVPMAKRSLREIEVDISGLVTYPEMQKAMKRASKGIDPNDLVKFTLVGQVSAEANKDLNSLAKSFEDDFFFSKIKDTSTLAIDPAEYENDISLHGEFIRTVLGLEGVEQSEKDRIVMCGLKALAGEKVIL